jgi:hypothetical protein
MQIFQQSPFENSKLSLTFEVDCFVTIHASNIQGNYCEFLLTFRRSERAKTIVGGVDSWNARQRCSGLLINNSLLTAQRSLIELYNDGGGAGRLH